MKKLLAVIALAACGDPDPSDRPDAGGCQPGACTPFAVCRSGARTCEGPLGAQCMPSEPLGAQVCGTGGTCAAGVCTAMANATIVNPLAGDGGFGVAVDIDNANIIVGAIADERAYVVRNGQAGFGIVNTLGSLFGPPGSQFGAAVAVEADLAAVGARRSTGVGAPTGDAGAVIIYQDRTGERFVELTQLIGPDGGEFGGALAISGTRILVGAELADGGGAAYLYERTGPATWTLAARFAEPGAMRLGHAVALQGDRAVVGSLSGAHVYDRGVTGWTHVAAIPPPEARAAQFGVAVAVEGDTVLVGAPGYSDAVPASGAAYVFERGPNDVYAPRQTLLPPTPRERGMFGRSVALDNLRAVISELDRTAGAGSTSLLRRQPDGSWLEVARHRDDTAAQAGFLVAGLEADAQLAVSGTVAVVGYPSFDGAGGIALRDLTGM